MLRTFDQHGVRASVSLDGLWDFVIADDRRDKRKLPRKYNRLIHVPSTWETIPGLENYRGTGWFRTTINSTEGMGVRLVFGGVSHTATVYVDGKKVGAHYDAYTPWDVVVTGLADGEHELVVEVDNSFGAHSALHKENDYYTYGGITRPAEAQLVDAIYIDNVRAVPVRRGDRWNLDVNVRLRNWSDQSGRRGVIVHLEDHELDLGIVTVRAGGVREVAGTLTSLSVAPWTAQSPQLYFLECLLIDGDVITDDYVERVGFREVKVRGKKLLLNGEPLRLRGYNRHEDHPQFGCAIPVEAMMTDLMLLRDLGANFIRTCHYPNDMRFLDLCDELGFCVWEESHARNVEFDHPKFREQITASTREMVERGANHPCIIMWGCLNECDSRTKGGRREHERVIKLLRKLDPTRPVTFASNKREEDICLDLVDIVSWNRYDAWYSGAPEDIEPAIRKILRWLHSPRSGGGRGKPVIMSECGAGAIYACRNPNCAKWTEEYQAKVLDETLRVYLNHPDIVGVAVWQFCDCRVTGNRWSGRPRTMNNKGTVDEFRRPKLAYEIVKRRFHKRMKK